MSTVRGRALRSNRGQATLELALILPVVLLVLFGITEFGQAFSSYVALQHAAREGARLGATGATDADIVRRVYDAAPALDPSRLTVTIVPAEGLRFRGDYLTVSLAYRFDLQVPLIQSIVGSAINLRADLTIRVE